MPVAIKHLRSLPESPGSVELLFREHCQMVLRAAYRVTGSAADAEDVLQTVFLRLMGRKGELDLSPSPASYLHRAAVNASLDLLRSRTRSKSVSIEEAGTEQLESRELDPESNHSGRELRQQIRHSVACLGDRAAEVIALKYFEDYDNKEIAHMLGTSPIVVAVTLHRARTRLRKEIGKYLEGYHEAN